MHAVVLGAGSWGTALALLLARNGHEVTLVGRNPTDLISLADRHENAHYLPGFELPASVQIASFTSPPEGADLWVVAVPSGAVEEALEAISGLTPDVLIASKGLDRKTASPLSDVVAARFPSARVGALSGPNLAVELARGVPSVCVCASHDPAFAEAVSRAFIGPTFRVYISDDLVGVELAGALKNVMAISAGVSDGLGFGDNTKAALIARGLLEMTRLGIAMGAKPETFFGIAGVGDLFATSNSTLSRNYRVGRALGEGRTLCEALEAIGQVAEGVATSYAAAELAARHEVDMPIFLATQKVISGELAPQHGVSMLMERGPKREGLISPLTAPS